jgi:hypothetical protein
MHRRGVVVVEAFVFRRSAKVWEVVVDSENLYQVMRRTYDELLDVVAREEFQALLHELYSLHPTERPSFVLSEILPVEKREKRGVILPEGILVQRSSFGDGRPTLFCIKKYLPEDCREFWENVNITFDNKFEEGDVPRDESAWRKPIPISVNALILAAGMIPKDVRK